MLVGSLEKLIGGATPHINLEGLQAQEARWRRRNENWLKGMLWLLEGMWVVEEYNVRGDGQCPRS